MPQIKDRTSESFIGQRTPHGGHAKTSDPVVSQNSGDISGEGAAQGAPVVPSYRTSPEVSEVIGDGERCGADTAMHGGASGPGSIAQGHASKCAPGPVVARPDLMNAHHSSSITHAEHHGAHGRAPLAKESDTGPGYDDIIATGDGEGVPASHAGTVTRPANQPPYKAEPGSGGPIVANPSQPRFSIGNSHD